MRHNVGFEVETISRMLGFRQIEWLGEISKFHWKWTGPSQSNSLLRKKWATVEIRSAVSGKEAYGHIESGKISTMLIQKLNRKF